MISIEFFLPCFVETIVSNSSIRVILAIVCVFASGTAAYADQPDNTQKSVPLFASGGGSSVASSRSNGYFGTSKRQP